MTRANTWPEANIEFLRVNYKRLSYAEIAKRLGRKETAVKSAAKRYRIANGDKYWTTDQKQTLIDMYPDTPTQQIADMINRDREQCYAMAAKLGLKKSEAYLASPHACRLRRGDNVGAATRFQKGQESWNKGTKGICGTHPASRATQFKKGERRGVANDVYKPVGFKRLTKDGYWQIKVNDDMPLHKRWEMLHHVVWEQAHGPIPPKMVIRFKDGDRLNCALDNLMLITHTEHILYNSKWNIPPELVPVQAALADLRREINNAEK